MKQVTILRVKYILLGLMLISSCCGKDLGQLGETMPIAEEDLLKVMMSKLQQLEQTGELQQHQQYIQNKVKQRVVEPVANKLPETVKQREFYYDPTITVEEDLLDHQGNIFRRKGEQINPLNTYSFKEPWLFFDANSKRQKQFALKKLKNSKLKLILIAGKPLDLMQEIKQPVYFDQFGWLIKKFNITQVPALVEQQGKKLKITEIELENATQKSNSNIIINY